MRPRYFIQTFGCQMNAHDSERMAGMLDALGYEPTPEAEAAALRYGPNHEAETAEAWLERWEQGRKRDLQFRTTLSGPHRDDFEFLVRSAAAKDFASEGQQRSLVIALRLAQAA